MVLARGFQWKVTKVQTEFQTDMNRSILNFYWSLSFSVLLWHCRKMWLTFSEELKLRMVRKASISSRMWQWRHMLSLHLKLMSRPLSSWTASELMTALYTVGSASIQWTFIRLKHSMAFVHNWFLIIQNSLCGGAERYWKYCITYFKDKWKQSSPNQGTPVGRR